MLDARGVALEIISGGKPEVLATIRERWPGLPLRQVPHVAENPGGVPRHVEITYVGRGQFAAFILDADGRELVRIRADSLEEIRALLREHYPTTPVRVMPLRNPAVAGWHKEGVVSDRALRYRAAARPPPGDRRCSFCGSSRNVEVGHVNGREEDNAPENKIWTCRPCNVRCGNALRVAGIGRPTRQYNPGAENQGALTLGQWLTAVMSMKGESTTMPVATAVSMIRATDPEQRSQFAREIWRLRRQHYGPAGRPAVPSASRPWRSEQ